MDSDQLRFYLDYRLPVDLRRVLIMPDVDVSYSIGTGLVGFDERGGITAALAASWKIDNKLQHIDFTLRPDAKWSDGSPIGASDVVASFEDAKKAISKDVPSVFDSYEKITAIDSQNLRFKLSPNISAIKFLERLCEPMYGLTKQINGKMDPSVTSGAYSLVSADEKEMQFVVNKHWYRYNPKSFSTVIIRRPPAPINAKTLAEDKWPMLVNIPNFVLKSEIQSLPKGYSTWRRHLDRLFALRYAGRSTVTEYRSLIEYIKSEGDLDSVVELIDHGKAAHQIYPKGMILYSKMNSPKPSLKSEDFKKKWPHKDVKIVYVPSRFPKQIRDSIEKSLCQKLPFPCVFIESTIQELATHRKNGTADLVLAGVGVDTINLDGALSYYFESEPNMIPSDDSEKGNFKKKLKEIRLSKVADPVPEYRKLMKDVIETHSILPLFHTSTTFIGRESVDFSAAPVTAETVPFFQILKR